MCNVGLKANLFKLTTVLRLKLQIALHANQLASGRFSYIMSTVQYASEGKTAFK